MNRFTFDLYFVFIASLLVTGCAVPTYLMNPSEPPQPSPEEKIQQTLESWKGDPISKAIREWGSPHGITDDDAGSKIYIWQMQIPVQTSLSRQERRILSRRQPSGLQHLSETSLSTDYIYEFMFYTNADGVIYKTFAKRDQDPSVGSGSLHFSQEKPGTTR